MEQAQIFAIQEYFRAMTPMTSGLPAVGPSKRMLGVLPTETNRTDGTFGPGTGGMSVSPDSVWNVPHHRRPRGMGRGSTGPSQDCVFRIENDALAFASLSARLDPPDSRKHAFVEPLVMIKLEDYTSVLVSTQSSWRRAWPL